jgi:diketogulonate reductase-like aldo/keto reductase
MMSTKPTTGQQKNRRELLIGGAAIGALALTAGIARAQGSGTRTIPSSGEAIPAVGLGTWITFNVGRDSELLENCAQVMAAFFQAGGRLIDSSPMYGSAQASVGHGLDKLGRPDKLFCADKVWTSAKDGSAQIVQSRELWRIDSFDLLQVHNLLGWEQHLPRLLEMKQANRLRYVGITTSEGRRHDLIEQIMRNRPIDFVQISYNVLDREVEQGILPLAQERGIGVIVNRPFRQGALTRKLAKTPLPPWAGEIGATSWAQIMLKFILSHPAVTVAIPATTQPAHAAENVDAAAGPMPDRAMRERIAGTIRAL